ncbi:arylesterase [Rhodocaloribacter sp.]
MRARSLYPLPLLCVLLLAACASEPARPAPDADAADSVSAAPGEAPDEAPAPERRTILFLGNSLTAGLGLDPEQAFPALIRQKIDSLGWPFEVVNAGLSGETTAGGLRRIDWLLRRPVDVLVLALGGNDGLRGIPPEVTKTNLEAIIDKARARYPDVRIILAGMQAPPNLGEAFTGPFRSLFPEVARERDVALIPFLLEGVGGVPELNQPDGIHPTAEGHRIVAETVWQTLRPILEAMNEAG